MNRLSKIISGGQTGADREALDVAMALAIPHGGWCPKGRLAEDGSIPLVYQLTETPGPDPTQRTEWNVRDSDGTVIFSIGPTLAGGSALTARMAETHAKPCLHLSCEQDGDDSARKLAEFLTRYEIKILNVAGPRASEEPEIAAFVRQILASMRGRSPLPRLTQTDASPQLDAPNPKSAPRSGSSVCISKYET